MTFVVSVSFPCRALHYDDPQLFPRQSYSDSSVQLLCDILQVRRDSLHVVATAKGQIMGALVFDVDQMTQPPSNKAGVKEEKATGGEEKLVKLVERADCNTGRVLTPYVGQIRGERPAMKQLCGGMSSCRLFLLTLLSSSPYCC